MNFLDQTLDEFIIEEALLEGGSMNFIVLLSILNLIDSLYYCTVEFVLFLLLTSSKVAGEFGYRVPVPFNEYFFIITTG
jgi:hypothetical protein